MEIHNLMEDLVIKTVDELFDAEAKGSTSAWCTCRQCRMDVACYVLNRLKPEYVLSGRGVAYSENDYGEKLQRVADVVSLVKEGWSRINAAPRPHHHCGSGGDESRYDQVKGPVFNFRPIMGRLFNGDSFEPIVDAEVTLVDESGPVTMIDDNWNNPYRLAKNTNGTFTFWPRPVPCDRAGERRRFSMTITASPDGFEDLSHYMEFELVSDEAPVYQLSTQAAHRLQDLYVFAK